MPMHESYRKSTCCGGIHCYLLDWKPNQPCWGQVDGIGTGIGDGDGGEIISHVCQGHRSIIDLGEYHPPPAKGVAGIVGRPRE